LSPILTPGGRRKRRWPWIVGGVLLVLAGIGVAVYFAFIKAPGNVSHPDVEFTAPKKAPAAQKRNTG